MSHSLRSICVALLTVGVFSAAVAVQNAARPSNDPPKEPIPAVGDGSPRWWKGNLHTHSLWSDGDDFPEMIADWYKRHGYQFLALTDHNILAEGDKWVAADGKEPRPTAVRKYEVRFGRAWVERKKDGGKQLVRLKPLSEYRSLLEEPGKFQLIPAEEITHRYARAPVHMNAFNLRDVVKPLDGGNVAETIEVNLRQVAEQSRKTRQRMIATVNHPNFGWGVRAEDMVLTDNLRFFEVFNGHPGVRNYGDPTHASVERMWDVLLALRLGKYNLPIVFGLATDDSHRYHRWGVGQVNPGRGWVMVRAPHLSAEAMLAAMGAGDFYATSGVVLDDVRRDGDELKLVIRGEPGVTYKTEFIATLKSAKLDSEPRRGADGRELPVTRVYSDEVGKVVATSSDLRPVYKFTGTELYVRAKVTSSKPHPNPYAAGDVEVAWTQPMRP
ncbi:MAG TPA: hypothetical protein VFG68_05730 [Fimbriiglobus sp.]|nr:hypothetical protein [Fimbriiglobus sp.]